ncbi:MAG TPA: CoA transferase [Candidatus Angelobacter sp.]|nr:CoA transferase [Candidatus Angelobacter sp.]
MKQLPLKGLKIVTVALNVPGPVAASRLMQLGADITKVEPPDGDPLKSGARAWYESLSAGQEVVTLDLKSPEGQAKMAAILANADLFLASFRPSALRRLRLDWETLHGLYPKLCMVNIIGFPPPDEEISGHDLTYQASLGLLDPPNLPVTLHADLAGSERAVGAALALLLDRCRYGHSGSTYVSLYEAIRDFTGPLTAGLTAKDGRLRGGFPFYAIYQANDGWIALGALEPSFIRRLREELHLTEDVRGDLARIFLTRSRFEWEAWAQEHDIPLVAVQSAATHSNEA